MPSPLPSTNDSPSTVPNVPIGRRTFGLLEDNTLQTASTNIVPAESACKEDKFHLGTTIKQTAKRSFHEIEETLDSPNPPNNKRMDNKMIADGGSILVPNEVTVQQKPLLAHGMPLYATNKTSLRPLFPLSNNNPTLVTGLSDGMSSCSSPTDMVVYRLLTLCFEAHLYSQPLVQSAMHDLSKQITNSVRCEEDVDRMVKMGVSDAVVHAMETLPTDALIQMDGCIVLRHLGKLSFIASSQQCTSRSEAIQVVLTCIEIHALHKELVELAVSTLVHTGAHFPYHEALFTHRNVAFLVRTISDHMNSPEVNVETLFLLGNLSCNLVLAQTIVEVGGVAAILQSMDHHWQNSKVCEGAALAIFKLAKWSSSRKRVILEQGGYDILFRVTKSHPD
jgi:hypothetical protein